MILFIALLMRLAIPTTALWISPHDRSIFHNQDDTASYIGPAVGLLNSGEFVNQNEPEIRRTPGYPLFLLPGLWIGEVELITIALQIMLNCITIFIVYKIAAIICGNNTAGVFAAALYAIDPSTLIQTSVIQTETLFAFMLTGFLFLMVRYLETSCFSDLLGAAIFSTACTYVKPLAYFMPFLVGAFLCVRFIAQRHLDKKVLMHVFLFFVVAMGPVFAWQVRNKQVTGNYAFSTIGGKDLYYDMACAILAKENCISFIDQKDRMGYWDREKYFSQHPEQRGWTESQIVSFQQKEALRVIVNQPWSFVSNMAYRALWTLMGVGLSDWLYVFGHRSPEIQKALQNRRDPLRLVKGPALTCWVTIFLVSMLAAYWGLVALGLLVDRTYANPMVLFCLSVAGYYILLPAVAGIGYARFRHPIIPVMCVFAGIGLFRLWHYLQHCWGKRASVRCSGGSA